MCPVVIFRSRTTFHSCNFYCTFQSGQCRKSPCPLYYLRLPFLSFILSMLVLQKCKLVHIAVNGSSFVFLQEIATKSSQKRSSKASPAILRINNRITSLPVQDVLALRKCKSGQWEFVEGDRY